MYYSGFADEAAMDIDGQIKVTQELGWRHIEARLVDGVQFHDLDDAAFERVALALEAAKIQVNCLGSAVANWAADPLSDADFELAKAQMNRALRRMKLLKIPMIRAMSFKAQWQRPAFDQEVENAVFAKVAALVHLCEEAGVLYLHENCNNYGGMSYRHTLKLLEKIDSPNFKLVFDTGNPALNFDRSQGDELIHMQDSLEFFRHVREWIHYVHIKDAVRIPGESCNGFAAGRFTFPGEGDCHVREIVSELLRSGYDGGFSIEPHMQMIFHAPNGSPDPAASANNYLEYGRRFIALVDNIKKDMQL